MQLWAVAGDTLSLGNNIKTSVDKHSLIPLVSTGAVSDNAETKSEKNNTIFEKVFRWISPSYNHQGKD